MFIPKRCPRCKDRRGWTEVYNPMLTNSIDRMIAFIKGHSTRNYVYRCEACGYVGEYDNHAESLERRRRPW